MSRIGVLVSGGGTNLQSIIDKIDNGTINGQIVSVVSSNNKSYALERAKKHKIYSEVIVKKSFATQEKYDDALVSHFESKKVDLILMAGFMVVLGENFVNAFQNKIMNIHPSLIPAFCGAGFYGLKVHESVLERGVKITGATVHFVNNETDGGPIILQKAVEVKENDTPKTLQKRVMQEAEQIIYPEAVKLFTENKIYLENNKVKFKI